MKMHRLDHERVPHYDSAAWLITWFVMDDDFTEFTTEETRKEVDHYINIFRPRMMKRALSEQ